MVRMPLTVVATTLVACTGTGAAGQSSSLTGLQTNATTGAQWRSYAGDIGGTNYSVLEQIDGDNFQSLEIAWQWSAEEDYPPRSPLAATPVMADGALLLYHAALARCGD